MSFLNLSVRVARGIPSAERKASKVCVPKKASRMMRKAQASETISSVRATEQLRSVLTAFPPLDAAGGFALVLVFGGKILAAAGIADGPVGGGRLAEGLRKLVTFSTCCH
ncbi:hypothetical protein [Bradyrhizobium sp. 1]|uniref:hypothetical protein n=1 Tax=Bradyrhizobium sp. 1 TaxID=241591 RepID=UPI001FF924B5